MTVADFQVECGFLTTVMTACGNFYRYDGSHGMGQVFTHQGRV